MPTPALLKRDWQKQHVYLIQYPRCKTIPNLSPWSLKLETWLRVMEIPFTNISNELKKFSAKGQVPFVELNGRQIADSHIIIETLKQEFAKSGVDSSDPLEMAKARALIALTDEHMTMALFALRAHNFDFVFSDDGWGRYFGTGLKRRFVTFMLRHKLGKMVIKRTQAQGMGRHSPDELHDIIKEDLKAISTFLGDKKYFGGERPNTLDCTVFGHVAGFLYIPTPNGILTKFVKESTPNLAEFVDRMKEKYWPDWEETCLSMNMNTHQKKN